MAAQADFRLNESDGNKRLHVPYSAEDTDRERRAHSFKGDSTPIDGDNDARYVTAYTTVGGFCNEDLPSELRELREGQETVVTCAETGETMAYTDTDGNQYALPNCTARVKRVSRDLYDFGAPRDWCYFGISLSGYGSAADKVN